ncbi:MAG TPA: hypothetical protein VKR53_05490 [Puia sp.]|nr:hypothetical protein [Puia sp.]
MSGNKSMRTDAKPRTIHAFDGSSHLLKANGFGTTGIIILLKELVYPNLHK